MTISIMHAMKTSTIGYMMISWICSCCSCRCLFICRDARSWLCQTSDCLSVCLSRT